MEIQLIYMTTGSKEEARTIGRELVQARLAACVNIFDNMNSIYRWEDRLQDDNEVVVIAKTTRNRVPELIEKVKDMHSYDCPCIISLPVAEGNPDFLQWIENEVG